MSIIPQKLKKGDKVMIIAPSRSLKLIKEDCRKIAEDRLNNLGLEVVFAPNTTDENCDLTISTEVKKRVDDIHTAFADESVKAILTVIGGFNSNQLIKYLDYDLIKNNPKIPLFSSPYINVSVLIRITNADKEITKIAFITNLCVSSVRYFSLIQFPNLRMIFNALTSLVLLVLLPP